MEIVIERSVEQHYKLEKTNWNHSVLKATILLSLIVVIGSLGVIKGCLATPTSHDNSNFSLVFCTMMTTFALTSLLVIYTNKSNKFKNLPYPTSIKLTDSGISIINPELTIIYNWDYFNYYYIKRDTIYIAKNKSLNIIITLQELTVAERAELSTQLVSKHIKRILV